MILIEIALFVGFHILISLLFGNHLVCVKTNLMF